MNKYDKYCAVCGCELKEENGLKISFCDYCGLDDLHD